MKPKKVKSSNIKTIGYEDGVLSIEYRGTGEVWNYPDYAETDYKKLMRAKSKGKFVETEVKPLYD